MQSPWNLHVGNFLTGMKVISLRDYPQFWSFVRGLFEVGIGISIPVDFYNAPIEALAKIKKLLEEATACVNQLKTEVQPDRKVTKDFDSLLDIEMDLELTLKRLALVAERISVERERRNLPGKESSPRAD